MEGLREGLRRRRCTPDELWRYARKARVWSVCALTSKRWCPMPREPRNIGASVRARLLDRARAERSDFQILLTRYALERLLYRLSVSPHRDRFILKGAMLFVTLGHRPVPAVREIWICLATATTMPRPLPKPSGPFVRSRLPMTA